MTVASNCIIAFRWLARNSSGRCWSLRSIAIVVMMQFAAKPAREKEVQSSRRRKGTLCRAACLRGAAREDWRNHGTHSRMRRARGQPKPRRVDDGDRDAGVHGGEPEQGVRPLLVGRLFRDVSTARFALSVLVPTSRNNQFKINRAQAGIERRHCPPRMPSLPA